MLVVKIRAAKTSVNVLSAGGNTRDEPNSAHVSLKSGGAKEANALGLFFSNHGHDDHRKVLTCSEHTNKLRSFILKYSSVKIQSNEWNCQWC